MRLALHDDTPVSVAISEGRFWKQGRSHRARAINLASLGYGLSPQFVVDRAETRCGVEIDYPTLEQVPAGSTPDDPCERCWE